MLENIPLFSGLAEDELQALESHTTTRSYRKNTELITRGDEAGSLYLILDGSVKVYIADENGKEVVLNTQLEGEHFGELALLGDSVRTASVMTLEDSQFMVISKNDFMECLSNNPGIALNLIRFLVERVSALTDNVGNLALRDVYGRVSAVLSDSAKDNGDGIQVTGKLTQQDIASQVGASREMVGRILKDLKTGGYISIDNKCIYIQKKLPVSW